MFDGISNILYSECGVSTAGAVISPGVKCNAIWDTGATGSMITQSVIDACGLKQLDTVDISHAVGTEKDVPVFLVNVYLPNAVAVIDLRVARVKLRNAGVLIGMDIINSGDFAVTNRGGNTKFSFRMPSQADTDFVAEDKQAALLNKQTLPSQQTREQKRRKRKQGKKRR